MNLFAPSHVSGDMISLNRTNPLHFNRARQTEADIAPLKEGGFQNLLLKSLGQVNDLQQNVTSMSQKMITDPESVDPHDLTIAQAKASTSLSMTKQIVEKSVQAYKNILSTR